MTKIILLQCSNHNMTLYIRGRKEMFYLTTHSTYFIYDYMASDHSVREETCCRHMGYSFQLAARVLLYAPSHRQDNTYHSLCTHQSWCTGWNKK